MEYMEEEGVINLFDLLDLLDIGMLCVLRDYLPKDHDLGELLLDLSFDRVTTVNQGTLSKEERERERERGLIISYPILSFLMILKTRPSPQVTPKAQNLAPPGFKWGRGI